MRLRRYRPTAIVLLLVHTTACMEWRLSPLSPHQLIEEESPEEIRVTLLSGERMVLTDPRIQADSVVGTLTETVDGVTHIRPAPVHVGDVQQIEVHHFNGRRTFGTVLAVAGVAAVVWACIEFSRSWEPFPEVRLPDPIP